MLTVQMDTERANKAIADNTLPQVMKSALERLAPESAYFGAKDGMRTGFFVFDLKELSDIPVICEPFFQEMGAKVNIIPVMSQEDLQAGLAKRGG
ncbi:hypothetical protein [Streptomyces sp. NPDC050145]|uniref:hypothetical protein n=1 Tax=Streptomyces sp. NPDC050145 TaxID=3365602 RepID=UPI0037989E4A